MARQRLYWCLQVMVLGIEIVKVASSSAAGQETLVGVVGKNFIMLGADSSVSQSIAVTASNLDKIAVLVDPFPHTDPLHGNNIDASRRQLTIVAAAAGDAADSDRLLGLLAAHAAIREYEAGVGCDVQYIDLNTDSKNSLPKHSTPGLTVDAVAHLARGQIAASLRSRSRLNVCLLIAGMLPVIQDPNLESVDSFSKRLQSQVDEASRPYQAKRPEAADSPERDEPLSPLEPRLYWIDAYGSLQKLQYGAHGLGANFCLSILDQGFRENLTRQEAADLIRDCFQQLRMRYVINSPQPPCIKCVDADGCQLIR